jgi:hypothetical protein
MKVRGKDNKTEDAVVEGLMSDKNFEPVGS